VSDTHILRREPICFAQPIRCLGACSIAACFAPTQRLGIDVNRRSEAITYSGAVDPRLIVLGPMTRGTFWEIVAVPDTDRRRRAV